MSLKAPCEWIPPAKLEERLLIEALSRSEDAGKSIVC